MATDYDAPRNADADQQGEPALQAIAGAQSSRAADPGGDLDPVEGEVALASADPTDEELVVPLVLPRAPQQPPRRPPAAHLHRLRPLNPGRS